MAQKRHIQFDDINMNSLRFSRINPNGLHFSLIENLYAENIETQMLKTIYRFCREPSGKTDYYSQLDSRSLQRWFSKQTLPRNIQEDGIYQLFCTHEPTESRNRLVSFCRSTLAEKKNAAFDTCKLFDSLQEYRFLLNPDIYESIMLSHIRRDDASVLAWGLLIALLDRYANDVPVHKEHRESQTWEERYLCLAYRGELWDQKKDATHMEELLREMEELRPNLQKIAVNLGKAGFFSPAKCVYTDAAPHEPLFFADLLDHVISLLRLSGQNEKADDLHAESASLRRRLSPLYNELEQGAPTLIMPKMRATLVNEPIFSVDFDSVKAAAANNTEETTRILYQLMSSGKTIVLSPSQLLDNPHIVSLLPEAFFASALQRGFITVSLYKQLKHPLEYLYQCLKSHTDGKKETSFYFSSCSCYNDEENGDHICTTVLKGLSDGKPFRDVRPDLPEYARIEVEKLYSCYRQLGALFSASTLHTYHQSNPLRPGLPKSGISLYKTVAERLSYQEEDERVFPVKGRAEMLEGFRRCQERAKLDYVRSDYRKLVENMKEEPYRETFYEFVNESYSYFIGSLITRRQFSSSSENPLFRLHSVKENKGSASGRVDTGVPFALEYYRQEGTGLRTILDQTNIFKIMEISRRLNSENRSAYSMEKELGIGFDEETGLSNNFSYRHDDTASQLMDNQSENAEVLCMELTKEG